MHAINLSLSETWCRGGRRMGRPRRCIFDAVDLPRGGRSFIVSRRRRETLLNAPEEFDVTDETREGAETADGQAGNAVEKSALEDVHFEELPRRVEEHFPDRRLATFAMVAFGGLRGVSVE